MFSLKNRALALTVATVCICAPPVYSSELAGAAPKIVNPSKLFDPAPYGFSHTIVAPEGATIAVVAGQGGETSDGSLEPDFERQVAQAYANLETAIAAVGASPREVIKLTTYVVNYDPSKLPAMTNHLRSTFGDWLPTQTLVPVPRLALDGMLFEVDAMLILPQTE